MRTTTKTKSTHGKAIQYRKAEKFPHVQESARIALTCHHGGAVASNRAIRGKGTHEKPLQLLLFGIPRLKGEKGKKI
jgi:hypothetical protein